MPIDFIDLPDLNRRKLINISEKKDEEVNITKDGFFDLSNKETTNTNTPQIPQEENFLSNFASIGSSQPQENKVEAPQDQDLKWRIENLEYKLEQLMEKLSVIEKQREQNT